MIPGQTPYFAGERRYFAYGSNMDPAQMAERCPNARYIGRAVLKDYDFDFTRYSPRRQCGVMDVVSSPGKQVWGVVYEMPQAELDRLDWFEFYDPAEEKPSAYVRKTYRVYPEGDDSKAPLEVDTYEVANKRATIPPSSDYMKAILTGAAHWGLPERYVDRLKAMVPKPSS